MIGVPKVIGYGLAMSFFTLMLMTSTLAPQIQSVYAGGKSPFESGYDHGCDDADISDPDDRYINQPEKGPSFHTDEFMRGYNDGYDECSGGSDSDGTGSNGDSSNRDEEGRSGGGGIEDDIRDACVDHLNMSPERCQDLIDAGKVWLICRGLNAVGIFFC